MRAGSMGWILSFGCGWPCRCFESIRSRSQRT
jgi:hypothetical protein